MPLADNPSGWSLPEPPWPSDALEAARWRYTRQVRRLIYGGWDQDLAARMRRHLGAVRSAAHRVADLSANLIRTTAQTAAVAYDRAPTVTVDGDPGALEAAAAAGVWSLLQRVQRDTWALREMYVHVDVTPSGRPVYRPVPPDLVLAVPSSVDPEQPAAIWEAEVRGKDWTWTEWTIEDPERPAVRVWDARRSKAISDRWLTDAAGNPAPPEGLEGDRYTWRRSDGTPILPYSLRHADRTGALHDPYQLRELVEATYNIAVYWSMFGHLLRNASWAQRYGIGVRLPSEAAGPDAAKRDRTTLDPATFAMFQPDEESGGANVATVGSLPVPSDPEKFAAAVLAYERSRLAAAGMNPADILRASGDPRSGYALAISRDGQREIQRRMEPVLRVADAALMERTAILLNRATGTAYPETGYRVTYEAVPLSATERKAQREDLLALIGEGLLDRVSAYQQLHPGLTRADAARQLDEIARINAQYRGGA